MEDTSVSPPETAASNTWTCTACDTTINIFHRDPHLLTRSHIRNSRLTSSPPPAPPPTHIWHCTPCAETMNIFHQEAHLASKRHRQRLLRPETLFPCGTCHASFPVAEVAGHTTTAETCVCGDCERVVHAMGQERHRSVCTRVDNGRQQEGGTVRPRDRPRATVEPEEDDTQPNDPPPPPSELAKKCPLCAKIVAAEHECVIIDCALCQTRVNRTNYASHLGTTRHHKAEEARWAQEQKACLACQGLEQEGHTCGFSPCGVCRVWVDSRFQAVHEATGSHRVAVEAGQKVEERKAAVNETPVSCPACEALVEEGHRCVVVQCDVGGGRVETLHAATKKYSKAVERARKNQEERVRKAQEGWASEGTTADIPDIQQNWCLLRGKITKDAHRWGVVMLTTDVDGHEAGVEHRVTVERRVKEQQQAREEERREMEREEKERKVKEEDEREKRETIEKTKKERKEREEKEMKVKEEKERKEREEKERKVKEEKERKEREEKERKVKEEKERKEREEKERKVKEEKERKVKEEDEREKKELIRKMEEERKVKEKDEREKKELIEKMEQERKVKEEKARKAKKERKRKAKKEKEQKVKEEDEREKKELIEKMEQERKAREEQERKAKEEKERKAKKERERKAKKEKEQKVREEKERKAKKEKARKVREEKERKAREDREKREKVEEERKEREKIEQGQSNAKKEEQRKERAKIKQRDAEQKQKLEKKKQEDHRRTTKQEHTVWTCTVCDRKMPTVSRDGHLAGSRHVKRARTKQEAEERRSVLLAEKTAGIAGPNMWDCHICKRTILVSGKDSHLAGKQHRSMQLLEEKKESTVEAGPSGGKPLAGTKSITPIVRESGLRDKIREQEKETENPPPIKEWNCEVCEWAMPVGSKASHLSGKKHRSAELLREKKEESAVEAGPAGGGNLEDTPPDPRAISPTVGETGLREAIEGKQKQTESPQPIKPGPHGKDTWVCEVCSRTMSAASKDSHLAGLKHRAMEQQQPPQHLEKQTSHNEEPGSREDHPRDCRIDASVASTISSDPDIAAARPEATEDEHSEWDDTVQETPQKVEQPSVFVTLRITPAKTNQKPTQSKVNIELDTAPPGQWHCSLCSRTMLLGSEDHHRLGREHRANYRAAKFPKGGRAPRQIHVPEDVSYCECGDKFTGGDWCRDCDFRADAGWRKQAKLK